MTDSEDSVNSTSVESVGVSDDQPIKPDSSGEGRHAVHQSAAKLRSAAGRAVSAAPQPVQDALTRVNATAQPALQKAKPHGKKIALALGGSLLIVIVTARRRRQR